jgi:hypothetical protein
MQPVSLIPVVHLDLQISPLETVLMGYSGAGGKLVHEKNQKQKISGHCPFKGILSIFLRSKFYENINGFRSFLKPCIIPNYQFLNFFIFYVLLRRFHKFVISSV